AAVVLAKTLDIPIVMGSATPSLETWNNAQSGRFHLHTMENRVADRAMPQIEVVDLREEKKLRVGNSDQQLPFWMSQNLHQEIADTLAKKEQVALFLNRRGVAPSVHCMDCGFVFQCANCAVSLTLHGRNHLVCHYCDFTQK